MKTVLKSLVVVLMFVGSVARAGALQGPELRDELMVFQGQALAKVLADSKDKNSEIYKILEKNDIEDGRNSRGRINLPLSAKDIKLTLISGEDTWGCHADNDNDTSPGTCSDDQSAIFLVSVASFEGVHRAVEFEAVNFLVQVDMTATWPGDHEREDKFTTKTVTTKFLKEIKIDYYN